jgi:tetratricopeptide (TPR) repeat protein
MFLICTKQNDIMLKRSLPLLISVLFFSAAGAQNNAAGFYRSGIQLKKNNKFPEAFAAFNKAISLKKNFDSAYVEIGNLYIGSGNVDHAIGSYKKALSINSRYTDAIIGLGKIYRDNRQNLDSALFYYSAAVKIDSTNKETFYALAWVYNAGKEYDLAINNAVKALEIDNTYRPAYGELGHAYRATKKYSEAIEQFKKNLAVSVVDLAYLYSGYCYTELNDKEGAMQQYEALNKINEKMAAALKKKIDTMQ